MGESTFPFIGVMFHQMNIVRTIRSIITRHPCLLQWWNRVMYLKHQFELWRLGNGQNSQYRRYLKIQFTRTFSKKFCHPGLRTQLLIDKLFDVGHPAKDAVVLCIGCRNTHEIDYFQHHGLVQVVGIDVYSESTRIQVMDMHHLTFPENSFDIIYSSHSLEHAYDPEQVARGIVRVAKPGALVAIEVPVKYAVQGEDRADLVDFENLDKLQAFFAPSIERVLWSEELAPHTLRNDMGISVVRTVFSIHKGLEHL
jgi:SAM-dependent methyltransferase